MANPESLDKKFLPDYELSILQKYQYNPRRYELDKLESYLFTNPAYREIHEALGKIKDPADREWSRLKLMLPEREDRVDAVFLWRESGNHDYYKEQLIDKYNNKIREKINTLAAQALAEGKSLEEVKSIIAPFESEIYGVDEKDKLKRWKDMINIWEGKKIVKKYFTWFDTLDMQIWGFREGNLVIIGAKTWVWKTLFALYIMDHLVQSDEKCSFFSLEMSFEELVERLVSMRSRIEAYLLSGKLESSLQKAVVTLEGLMKDYEDSSYLYTDIRSIEKIEETIRADASKGVKAFFIDYVGIADDNSKSEYEKITNISRRLKSIASELWVVIFWASQLRKDSSELVGDINTLKWSWALAADSDVVLLISRTAENTSDEWLEVLIAKNRKGSSGDTIQLNTDLAIMLITEENLPDESKTRKEERAKNLAKKALEKKKTATIKSF